MTITAPNDPAHDTLDALFDALWRGYLALTPLAGRIRDDLRALGNPIVDDHIAIRTFDRGPIELARFVAWFEAHGYVRTGAYHFADKRLDAVSLSHGLGRFPRVFVSELRTGDFSHELQRTVAELVASVAAKDPGRLLSESPSWPPITMATYERLLAESEYAAWTAAFGLRANHFTLSVGDLVTHRDIPAVNAWLEARGVALNTAGGAVKGTPADLLEQSSTLAEPVAWSFADGVVRTIPGVYTELALRHVDPATGRVYEGFVPASADRIFESTDASRRA